MPNMKEIIIKLYIPDDIDIDGLYEYFFGLSTQKIETIHAFVNSMQSNASDCKELSEANSFFSQVDNVCDFELSRRVQPCDRCFAELNDGSLDCKYIPCSS